MLLVEDILLKKVIKFIEDIDKKYPIEFAYIFGSIVSNENNNMSDIDIAIKFKYDYTCLKDALIRGEIIDLGQSIFNMPLDVLNLAKASIFLKHQVVKYGIVLVDCDERSDFESLVFREYFDFKYYSDIYDEAMLKNIKANTFFGGSNG